MVTDWYERRHELKSGMVFRSYFGVVKLDRGNPGDGTQWIVQDWCDGYDGSPGGWASYESTIEPGDLKERLPDNYAGDPA